MHFSLILTAVAALTRQASAQDDLPGKFELAGRSGVPVMHAALLPNGKVVFLDKLENYTESKLPTGRYAYSVEYDPATHELFPLSLSSNAFCCGGAFLADGTLLTVGGNGPLSQLDDSIADGFDALRYLGKGWVEYPGVHMDSRR